jgi:hypothetical protein
MLPKVGATTLKYIQYAVADRRSADDFSWSMCKKVGSVFKCRGMLAATIAEGIQESRSCDAIPNTLRLHRLRRLTDDAMRVVSRAVAGSAVFRGPCLV